jgi:hypothetical protein
MRLLLAVLLVMQASAAFTTLDQGTASEILEPRELIVRTEAEWRGLWKMHRPRDPVPAVDFATHVVAGVFLGTRPTAGFAVEIDAVTPENGVTRIRYVERRPASDGFVAQVLTSPFHIVCLPRPGGRIEFQRVSLP